MYSIRLEQLQQPVPDAQALTWCIGPPLRQSFVELAGLSWRINAALYRQRFAKIGLYENQLYKGVPELLSQLRDRRLTCL